MLAGIAGEACLHVEEARAQIDKRNSRNVACRLRSRLRLCKQVGVLPGTSSDPKWLRRCGVSEAEYEVMRCDSEGEARLLHQRMNESSSLQHIIQLNESHK